MKDSVDSLAVLFPGHAMDQASQDVVARIESADAARLARYLYRELKNAPHASAALRGFVSRVQSSALTPQEWASQILSVYEWLEKRSLSARFEDVVEYISCAIEGSSLQPGHSMEWYLEQYGFEKSAPR